MTQGHIGVGTLLLCCALAVLSWRAACWAATTAAPLGDVERGRALFMGEKAFQNGGAPCMACHSVAGVGALGGGMMGPDLTTGYARFRNYVTYPPRTLPPMKAIFSARPLTPQEEADLTAFFRAASVTRRSTAGLVWLSGLALAGGLTLLLTFQLIWRRRLRGVRKPLLLARR